MSTRTVLRWPIQSGGLRQVHARLVEHAPGDGFRSHAHDYIECFCVDAGSLLHSWEGEDQQLVPGDVVALLPGERHAGIAGSSGARIINISCAFAALSWLRRRCGALGTPWDGDRPERLRVIGAQERAMLRSVVGVIDQTQASARDLVLLALSQAVAVGDHRETVPVWLDRVLRDHVDAGDPGGVAALAQRCGLSREHLSRQVRRLVGLSVATVLRNRRLDQAALRLRGSDLPLAQVMSEVGFRSQSAFYAGFTGRFGCSPAQYRKQRSELRSSA